MSQIKCFLTSEENIYALKLGYHVHLRKRILSLFISTRASGTISMHSRIFATLIVWLLHFSHSNVQSYCGVCVCTRAKRHRYVEGCLANFLSNVKVPLNLNRIPLSWTPYQIYLGLAFCALQSNKSNKRFSWDKFTSCWLWRLKHNIWNGNDIKMFNTIFRITSFPLFPFLFGCCCCFLGYLGSFIILQTYPNFRGCWVRARDYHV